MRLTAAADQLAAAVIAHSAAVTQATGQADFRSVLAASEELLAVVLQYADAQFDYTGYAFPFGVLHQFEDDDLDDDDTSDGDSDAPTSGLSVVRRHDLAVTDEEAVLAAGRAAYLRTWPDDSEADAIADVTDIGRALYQLGHADGWDALNHVAGLQPTAGLIRVVRQDQLLGSDPAAWPPDVFQLDGETVYQQAESWA